MAADPREKWVREDRRMSFIWSFVSFVGIQRSGPPPSSPSSPIPNTIFRELKRALVHLHTTVSRSDRESEEHVEGEGRVAHREDDCDPAAS